MRMRYVVWFILGLLLIIVSGKSDAAPTPAGQAMFNKLVSVSGIHVVDKRVTVLVQPVDGSYTDGRGLIHIAKTDIAFCSRDLNCIAFIVAHELGHNVLGHTRGNDYPSKQQERDSDIYGMELTKAAGFDPCAGAKFFEKLITVYGDGGGVTHPMHSERVKYMEAECHSPNIPSPPAPWRPHLKVYTRDFIK